MMDNFKGQIILNVLLNLQHNIHHCLVRRLLATNGPHHEQAHQMFSKACRAGTYLFPNEVLKQLQEKDLDTVKLQPITLNLPCLKEIEERWLHG